MRVLIRLSHSDFKLEPLFDEIHFFSDKVANLDINLSKNVYVYTTSADEEVNKASRTLYTNLKLKNFELKHKAI